MSVINQMLKDLDKRQHEQQHNSQVNIPVSTPRSNIKSVLFGLTLVALIFAIAVYIWMLLEENTQLKAVHTSQSIVHTNQVTDLAIANVDEVSDGDNAAQAINTSSEKEINAERKTTNNLEKKSLSVEKNISQVTEQAKKVEPIKPEVEQIPPEQNTVSLTKVDDTTTEQARVLEATKKPTPTLKISRHQLTPSALAQKKIAEAEQAIENKDIAKAEMLFEDVLLLLPEHETARKQLAALWYGKKSYQDAVNLLSQGIALAPQSQEMRLMSARIYFEKIQYQQAYNILTPVDYSDNVELQSLLASAATELNDHDAAIAAYLRLTLLEPTMGRWHLGLAISYDTLGKFSQARDAYNNALEKNNLSVTSANFARQRVAELGD